MNLLTVLREEKETRMKGGIYHYTQIKLAYNTNRIEGSKLSEEQTRYIYETNTLFVENGETTAAVEDIIDFHYHFEQIHPFQDGNGRVGRLIIFKECLAAGMVPFIIEDDHKFFYYRGLAEYPHVKGYLVDTCLSSQDTYGKMVDYFSSR